MTELTFQPGDVVGERYQLQSKLGEGGMGAVWRAVHLTLKSPVALKFISSSLATSPIAVSRFMREAQSSAALRSSHIVQVFDFGVDRGVPYIAMELLSGETLAARLDRVGSLSLEDTSRVLGEVARAVDHAHGVGVIHRDLKPDNIFLVQEGSREFAKVLDFGIAKVTGVGVEALTGGQTQTGMLLGTPFYVSPEQGLGNRRVDHKSDLWALGVITYECVAGAPPFRSDGLGDLIVQICSQPHAPLSATHIVPSGLDEWMTRALAKAPEQRFAAAVPMFEELATIVGRSGPVSQAPLAPLSRDRGSNATPISAEARMAATESGVVTSNFPRRSKARPLALLALFGGLLATGAIWLFPTAHDSEDPSAKPNLPSVETASPTSPPPLHPVVTQPGGAKPENAAPANSASAAVPSVLPIANLGNQDQPAAESGKQKKASARRAPRRASKPATDLPPTPPQSPAPAQPGPQLFDDRK